MPEYTKQFGEELAALCAAFGRELTEPTILAYWIGLQDLPLADVQQAIHRALRECKYMPVPAEIRRLAGGISTQERAIMAWDVVRKNLNPYESVNFDDPIVNATIRNMGGWLRLCSMETEEFNVWARKEFERIYCALTQAGISEEQGRYLVGVIEQSNGANGWGETPEVRQIATGGKKESINAINPLPLLR